MGDFDDAAAEIVDGLGSSFVYFDGEELRQITGIFSNAFQKVEGERGPGVSSRRPELQVLAGVITDPKPGDLVFRGTLEDFVGDFDYEVVKPRSDEEETVASLILKQAT